MEFCTRCDGGAIHAPNCPVCGGSGFIVNAERAEPVFKVPSPFANTAMLSREAREQEKRRKVKAYKTSSTPDAVTGISKTLKVSPKKDQKAREKRKPNDRSVGKKPAANSKPRQSKKSQSEKRVANSAMADQLKNLKPDIAFAPAKPKNKKHRHQPGIKHFAKKKPKRSPQRPVLALSTHPRENLTPEPAPEQQRQKMFIKVIDGRLEGKSDVRELSESRFLTTDRPERPKGGASQMFSLYNADEADQRSGMVTGGLEPRRDEEDGGRYMGHSFRDNDGSYGSLPSYDDYDDPDNE